MSLPNIIQRLTEIYEIYGNQHQDKLYEFIDKELPERMKLHLQREHRREQLEQKSDYYINNFLYNRGIEYFYLPIANIFVAYNGEITTPICENIILHEVLTGISSQKELMPWKYKIKNLIMKQLKQQTIFQFIPESHTIQSVLAYFTPTLFNTKEESKYFLTILGDNILKKHSKLIHLVDPRSKDFISSLQTHLYPYFKNTYHLDTTFKYKYHEHDYDRCRILTFNHAVATQTYWETFVKPHLLDIISVALHYSKRFQCSDNYLLHHTFNNEIYSNIFYLKNHTEIDIIQHFIKEYIVRVPKQSELVIRWKELYYVWKFFLKEHHLPSIMFIKQLRTLLNQQLECQSSTDIYPHITSPILSYVSNIRRFWHETITTDESDEFEISELCNLYDLWLKNEGLKKAKIVNEAVMISIVEHFYDIIVVNNKCIQNIKCIMWNKQEDMKIVLRELKIRYKFSPELYERSMISIYSDYCAGAPNILQHENIVSKQYFSKYICQVIPEQYIKGNKISEQYWST